MAGSVYSYTTKGGQRRWGFALDLPRRGGKRQQLRKEGYRRKLDAANALSEEQHGVQQGTAPSLVDRRLSVAQWADKWLESRVSIRPTTRHSYAVTLANYVKPAIGHIPLAQLCADDLDAMFAQIRDGRIRPQTSRRRGDGRLAASSVRQVCAVTTAMLNAAVKKRRIAFNPAVGIEELEQAEHRERPAWGPDQVARFLEFAEREDPRLAIAWWIALSYALRRGEVAGLRWSDIDTRSGSAPRPPADHLGRRGAGHRPAQDHPWHPRHPAGGWG
jgi:integrase